MKWDSLSLGNENLHQFLYRILVVATREIFDPTLDSSWFKSAERKTFASDNSKRYAMKPFLDDQYRTAQAYFLCILGLVLVESLIRLPLYLIFLIKRGMGWTEYLKDGITFKKSCVLTDTQ